jgi:hypothetical protein
MVVRVAVDDANERCTARIVIGKHHVIVDFASLALDVQFE